jgi:hypothetical protein
MSRPHNPLLITLNLNFVCFVSNRLTQLLLVASNGIRYSNFTNFEILKVLFIRDLIQEVARVFDIVSDTLSHGLDQPKLA